MTALAWSLGLFALVKSPWGETALVLPLTRLQEQAAEQLAGRPSAAITVGAECSGADVLALCVAAVLACPVSWRVRLAGAAGAVALILALNTLRIATLGSAATSPVVFQALHLQVWPAILVLATAVYVFAWMRSAVGAGGHAVEVGAEGVALSPWVRCFMPRAAILLVAFALCGPWIAQSETLLQAGAGIVRAAAFVLTASGLSAAASGNVVTTSRGAFQVTPECLATALIPLYLAGVSSVRRSWRWRALALVAALPLFAALALLRLLLLALPPALAASPLFLVHGFHQLVLAAVLVSFVASRQAAQAGQNWAQAAGRAGVALAVAVLLALLAGRFLAGAVLVAARAVAVFAPHTLTELAAPGDAQGALALLPAYQAGLLLALGMTAHARGKILLAAFGLLFATQVVFLVALGELADHAGLVAHALMVRAWAVAVPVVLALTMFRAREPLGPNLAPLQPAIHGS